MSVKNEQKVNETVTNAAFVSKITDSNVVSRINLIRAASGDNVNDVQLTINNMKSDIQSESDVNDTQDAAISTLQTQIVQKVDLDGVEAGTNITITGDGTSADPFVISASGGGILPAFDNNELLIGDGTTTPTTLNNGSDGQVLKIVSGTPAWSSTEYLTGRLTANTSITAGNAISFTQQTSSGTPSCSSGVISGLSAGLWFIHSNVIPVSGSNNVNVFLRNVGTSTNIFYFGNIGFDSGFSGINYSCSGGTIFESTGVSDQFSVTTGTTVQIGGGAAGASRSSNFSLFKIF